MTERHYDFTQIPHLKLSAGKHDSPNKACVFMRQPPFSRANLTLIDHNASALYSQALAYH
jgi:hypothetical protein